MRSYRKTIALLIVLALFGGLYAFAMTRKDKPAKVEEPVLNTAKIYEVAKDKISEVTIVNTEGKFVFTKKDKAFVMSSPTDFKADSAVIDSIISSVAYVSADKVVEESAADLTKYGFNSKSTQIAVKYDGGVKELEIGDINSTKDAYYIKEKANSKVYTLGTYSAQAMLVTKAALRDKTLFTIKADEILNVSMSKASQLIFSSKKTSDGQWALTAPIEGNGDASKIGPMLESFAQVSAYLSFVEENATDLEKYGLKNPAYSMTVETAAGKTTLLLGNDKVKGKETYAKLGSSNQIVTIDPTPFNFLDKPLKEIMEVFAYIVNIADVSKIAVEMDGKTTVSEIVTDKDDKDKDKFTVDGKDASVKDEKDNSLFRKYYQALIGITMSEIDANSKPSGKADITITYSLKKDPGTMKVEFISKDANYYYVVKNGKYANILVEKKKFDEAEGLRETYKKLMEAIAKK